MTLGDAITLIGVLATLGATLRMMRGTTLDEMGRLLENYRLDLGRCRTELEAKDREITRLEYALAKCLGADPSEA